MSNMEIFPDQNRQSGLSGKLIIEIVEKTRIKYVARLAGDRCHLVPLFMRGNQVETTRDQHFDRAMILELGRFQRV